jgi:cell division protease FtsH
MESNFWRNIFIYLLAGVIILAFFNLFNTGPLKAKELTFSDFLNQVDSGAVSKVTIVGDQIQGEFKNKTKFTARAVEYPELLPKLREKGVTFDVQKATDNSWILNIFIYGILPILLMVGFFYYVMRQASSTNTQAIAFGKTKARAFIGKTNVTFADVAGIDEAKDELAEIVDFLKYPEKYAKVGARVPRGLLLIGAPGTGKTLLAKAIAGEAGVPFFSLSGSDFVEMFVGVGASRVRDLFAQAKKAAPAIIFVDEIDAVGRHRGAGLGGAHDEREQTLNQLLSEMDGFDSKTNVIIVAATNRPDILDPALLRPGRFDRHIVLDKPDLKGREAILKVHAKNKPFVDEVSLSILARRTPGFSGADLENLLNEAALLTARFNKEKITMVELEEAIDRVVAGPQKKSRMMSEKERKAVAYHEVGHAILGKIMPSSDPVHKISILPRGMALGYTLQLPERDKHLVSEEELLSKITVYLGGRVAEELMMGEITSGAQNDLEEATKLAKKMVTEFGMSKMGLRSYGKKDHQVFLGKDIAEMRDYGDNTANEIDKEVAQIINNCLKTAREKLSANKAKIEEVSALLIEKETLEGEDLDRIMDAVVSKT